MPIFAASASKAAIEAASDVHKWELDEGLGQLVELWLLEAGEKLDASKRRYNLHPLTRAFAQNRLSENPNLEHRAKVRLVEYLESFAKAAGGDKWEWERYDEIEDEKDNIFALIDWCFENREAIVGINLTKSVTFFMSIRGYLSESFAFGRKAAEIARQNTKKDDLAWLLVKGIGLREINGGNLEEGEALIRECFEKGMALAKSSFDELAVASFKRELSELAASEGKLMEAKEGLESVIPILREQNELTLSGTLGNLAEVNRKLGQYDTAYEIGYEGLELAKKMKKRETIAWISRTLAYTEAERGNYLSALSFAQQAMEFYEKSGLFFQKIEEVKTLINELQGKLAF